VFKVYTMDQTEEWDAIVRTFREYDTYWLSGYVKAFQIHGDGDPLLLFFQGEGSRGINVVMKRDVALDPHFSGKLPQGCFFDFSTPYGYGGWLIEGEDPTALFVAYEEYCVKHGIVSEFARFHPLIKNHERCDSFYETVQLGEVVHMELFDRDRIWENVTSKNRNMIRKAMKNGVKVYHGRFPDIYRRFRVIYNETMRSIFLY